MRQILFGPPSPWKGEDGFAATQPAAKRHDGLGGLQPVTDDRAPSMRHAAALLLLLLLPGLILPGGMLLHLCRCEPTPGAEPRACCQQAAAHPATTNPRACCHRQPTGTPHDEAPRADDDRCGCQWLPLPETRDDPAPPDLTSPLTGPTARALEPVEVLPPTPLPAWRAWQAADSRPPPAPSPGRNLPLRL